MKKLFLALALVSSTTYASQKFELTTVCSTGADIYKVLTDYDEKPMLKMKSNRLKRGTLVPYSNILFVNAKEGSFTMVEQYEEDLFCVVALGTDLEPYMEKK